MPTVVTAVVSATCDLCGKIFEGEGALEKAQKHEKLGVPVFRYPAGITYVRRQFGDYRPIWKVFRQVIGNKAHGPCYGVGKEAETAIISEANLEYHLTYKG